MVESGQRDVIDIAYDNPDRLPAGLEVLTFTALKSRLRSSVARRPSRLDFHQVMLVRGGKGTAMVDFVAHPCTRGTLLHLRPGQVQRLPSDARGRPADLDAVLLLFTADFPRRCPPPARCSTDSARSLGSWHPPSSMPSIAPWRSWPPSTGRYEASNSPS